MPRYSDYEEGWGDPTYQGQVGGDLAQPYVPEYERAGPPTDDGRRQPRGGLGYAIPEGWTPAFVPRGGGRPPTEDGRTIGADPTSTYDADYYADWPVAGAADGGAAKGAKGAKGAKAGKAKKKKKKEMSIKDILKKSRNSSLKDVNKTFKPLFKEMNRQLEAGTAEAGASGEEARASIGALADDLRGALDAIDEQIGRRRGDVDADFQGSTEQAGHLAQLRELQDGYSGQLRGLSETNLTGLQGMSEGVEQASLSQLRNNDARLRAQLKAQRGAQRGAVRSQYREQLLAAKVAKQQAEAAAAASRGGGGGGGGYRGSGSSGSGDGPSADELAAAAQLEQQLGLPPGTLVAADVLGLSGTVAGHQLDQNRDDARDEAVALGALPYLAAGEDMPFDLYGNQYALAQQYLGTRENQYANAGKTIGKVGGGVIDAVFGKGSAPTPKPTRRRRPERAR